MKTTIVNGKILMRDGKVLTLNEPAMLAGPQARRRRAAGGCEMNVLLEADQIQRRITELAGEIEADYPPDEEVHLVGVLKGGFVFMAGSSAS